MNDTPWIEARTIDLENVRETYALAARHVLADVAADYRAVITVPELAQKLQDRTRIRNRQAPGLWIGDVLFRVAKDCQRRREPLLGSLVVGTDGHMPEWYADTVNVVRGDVVTNPELHAAEERLECYRTHGADLPADGGEPALPVLPEPARRAPRTSSSRTTTPRATTSRTTSPRAAAPRKAATPKYTPPAEKFCPSCFMVLPATGRCDNCD